MSVLDEIKKLPVALTFVATTVPKIQAAIPKVAKLVQDIKQAAVDQKNPAAFEADLMAVLADITDDLSTIAGFFPPVTPTPITAPATAAQ